jgi:hypothetical protein
MNIMTKKHHGQDSQKATFDFLVDNCMAIDGQR